MELIAELVNNQFMSYIPVALVLVALTLLFTFGFKPSEQPSFDKLSVVGDDRKAGAKKQRKIKDKKTANGSAVSVSETKNEKSKEVKQSPTKETPNTPKQTKKPEANVVDKKKGEVKVKKLDPVEVKNKKNAGKVEKPADFDDGNWEMVPSKNDKKKKQDSPKKEKKATKVNKEEDSNKENKVENVVKEKAKKDDEVKESAPEPEKKEESVEEKEALAPVFDELGDAWAEAKQPRKSKKKSRRDN